MPYYSVIDSTKVPDGHYLRVFFRRNESVKNDVPIYRWIWLTTLEIIFGKEILEHMVINASVDSVGEHPLQDHGKIMHLSRHIPSGFFTNLFRNHLINLLYYKFYRQYNILAPEEIPCEIKEKMIVDCSRNRFRVNKKYFEELISFRRVYDVSWLIVNFSTDAIVYILSTDLTFVVFSALGVEAFRRLLKA